MVLHVKVIDVVDEGHVISTQFIPSCRWDMGGVKEIVTKFCVKDAGNVAIVMSEPV